jgi:hypothetical protein
MAVRDEQQQTADRSGGMPPWKDTVGHLPAVLAVGAVVLYAFLSLCYDSFYRSLAVEPSDVGLTYAGTLARSSGFVIVYAFMVGFTLQPGLLRKAEPELGEPSPRMRRFEILLAVGLLVLVFGWPFIGTTEAANAVKAGEPVRPLLLPAPAPPLPILAIRADPATVEPAGKPGESPAAERLRGRRLLYLGQAGGTVVLYDAAEQHAVYMPASSIILKVANCGAKLPPDRAGVKRPPDAACERMRTWFP